MEGDEDKLVHYLRYPSYFVSAHIYSDEIVLVYVQRKNSYCPIFTILLYLAWAKYVHVYKK